jgi:hypothetical protein
MASDAEFSSVYVTIGLAALALTIGCVDNETKSPTGNPSTPPVAKVTKVPSPVVQPGEPPTPPAPVVADPEPAKPADPPPAATTMVEHVTPGGITESCQLLVEFPFTPPDVAADPEVERWYRNHDFSEIADLCKIDFYAPQTTQDVTAVGVCTKVHWSTPALEVHAIDQVGMKKSTFERYRCKKDRRRRGAKKVAKLKIPMYHREPESGLLYFHFSRLLGHNAFVYPTTYRTVSRREFRKWASVAIDTLTSKRELHRLNPLGGWRALFRRHRKGKDVLGGAFAENPRGEKSHYPFKALEDRKTIIGAASVFRKRPYFKVLASRRPVTEQLDFDKTRPRVYDKSLQALTYAHDFSQMVILDTLFQQRDRGGNINSLIRYHSVDDKGRIKWKKKIDNDDDAAKMVKLERVLLKDNDDGLKWDTYGAINLSILVDEVRHLDKLTYERMQWLAGLLEDPASRATIKTYFVESVHVGGDLFDAVADRFIKLAARFEKKHADGKLMLDLGLEPLIADRPPPPPDKVARSPIVDR